jgi:hypothetical protein
MGFNSGFKGLMFVETLQGINIYIYDIIYLLTAVVLSPGGCTHLHKHSA